MQQPVAHVADALFELVIDIDPARTSWEKLRVSAREKAKTLALEIDALLAENPTFARLERSVEKAVREALASASASLNELSDALANGAGAARWRQIYAKLARSYDELTRTLAAARLETKVRFRQLAPVNYTRNVFHVASGVVGALAYHYLLDRTQALIVMAVFALSFTALEIIRRRSASANEAMMRFPFFRRIARAREYYAINSSTYYAWGLLVCVLLFPRHAVEAGCLVLAFGDPAAANLGRRYGQTKIFRNKSLVGSCSFFAAGFAAVLAFGAIAYPAQAMSTSLLIAGVAALAGTVAEALTARLDDNMTVPFSVALAIAPFVSG